MARIVYLTGEGGIATVAADGGGQRLVTGPPTLPDRVYNWPTWSPDGRWLSLFHFDLVNGRPARGRVGLVPAEGGDVLLLHAAQNGGPIYHEWSPDSRWLACLMQEGDSLVLVLVDPVGQLRPRPLVAGAPLYFSWAPDSERLLLHVGGPGWSGDSGLALLRVTRTGSVLDNLPASPSGFRAPGWSPDGSAFAYAVPAYLGGEALVVQAANRQAGERIALTPACPAFLWSPRGDLIAYSSPPSQTRAAYDGLWLVHPDGSEPRQIVAEALIAFFWAPDGQTLAYVTLGDESSGLTWHLVPAAGGPSRRLASFLPPRDFGALFPFFDQYAQGGARLWAPDSTALVYANDQSRLSLNGHGPGRERVFVAATAPDSPPRAVATGGLAFWGPEGTG